MMNKQSETDGPNSDTAKGGERLTLRPNESLASDESDKDNDEYDGVDRLTGRPRPKDKLTLRAPRPSL